MTTQGPVSDESRLADAIAEYLDLQTQGAAPSVSEFARAHPPIADALATCLRALSVADTVPASAEAEAKSPAAPPIERLGDFRILGTIGRGGMGVVYEAEQVSLPRRVALKVVPPGDRSDPDRLRRFRREIETTASLQHPNIVPVLEAGEVDGLPYYAMPLLEGQSLDKVIASFRAEPKTVPLASRDGLVTWIARFIDVARALATAHQAGIVHRDIKPSNLFLSTDGRLSILDFGLTRADAPGRLSQTGAPVGTPRYMSPEQILHGKLPVDGRSDVFGLAATLYEVLTQVPAFDGDSVESVFRAILSKQPVPPRRIDPRMPDDLEAVVMKALEKDTDFRYPNADELADDLLRFLEYQPVRAKPASLLRRLKTRSRGNPALTATVLVATIAVAAAAFAVAWQTTKRQRMIGRWMSQVEDHLSFGRYRDADQILTLAERLQGPTKEIEALRAETEAGLDTLEEKERAAAATERAAVEIERANLAAARARELSARITELRRDLRREKLQIFPWDQIPSREKARLLERSLDEARAARDAAFREVMDRIQLALRITPDADAPRAVLREAIRAEFGSAEMERDAEHIDDLEPLVGAQFGETTLASAFDPSTVTIESVPAGADVWLFRYGETRERLLVPRPYSLEGNGLLHGPEPPRQEPWISLGVVAPAEGPARSSPLAAGSLVTTICGRPPLHPDWARRHLAEPHAHVLQARSGVDAFAIQVEPGQIPSFRSEIERRSPYVRETTPWNEAGQTPTGTKQIERGSYLAILRRPGYPEVLYPFEILRGEAETVRVTLPPAEAAIPGYVHVPEGPIVVTPDHESRKEGRASEVVVAAFSIAAKEVTFAEYAEFVSRLAKMSTSEATARLPRGPSPGSRLGRLVNLENGSPTVVLEPPDGDPSTALIGISKADAEAYCRFLTTRDGRPAVSYRLPTEAEWERAARGADARRFVWGDTMDWTFARTGLSAPNATILPGGLYPADESVFGALDMNGNAREWCSLGDGSEYGILKGGAFTSRLESDAHLASRAHVRPADYADETSGLRVVMVTTPK